MRLVGFELVPYRLPVDPPFRWRGGEVGEREGVLLRLVDASGLVGWGDAAPLQGFSAESVEDARSALDAAMPALVGGVLDDAMVVVPDSDAARELDGLLLPASARYALDLALADLAAAAAGLPLHRFLAPRAPDLLRVAALVDAEPDGVVDAAGARAAEGYRALKLKAGRLDPESDAELARDVRRRVGRSIELRVDANRAWSPDQAATFAARAAPADLAYVEEPLAEGLAGELEAFARDTGLPVALDETLTETDGQEHIGPWLAAVVLKPTVVGGIAAARRLAGIARECGVDAVLSAAFESGVGQRGVAALASATGGVAAGLDPYRRLVRDVLTRPLPFDRPEVDLAALFAAPAAVAPAAELPVTHSP